MTDAGICTEPELTQAVDLCTPDGRLNPAAIGWSRQPLHNCALPNSWGRRKRWDFWGITGDGFAMNVVYADVDYIGLVGAWFCDFATRDVIDLGAISPLARAMSVPETVAGRAMTFTGKRLELSLSEEQGGTRIRVRGRDLSADVFAHRPDGHESLGVVIPWSARRFQYTNKDVARPADGSITWRGRDYAPSWACLDFGRGKWPYRTKWNWGAGAGTCDGRRIGVQIGGKWTDGTGMTENALSVDGKLSKISEELVWTYDTSDWLSPWTIRTPQSSRVDLTFTPIYDKPTRLNLGVASQSVDQCFGTYAGTIVPDDGVPLRVDDIFGWAEEATWKW
jgi:hypothetical protein